MTQTGLLFRRESVFLYRNRYSMDWQNILMIVLTVLLLGVWLPLLIVSVRKALRKENKQLYTDENK